jgi:hypothetical protein
MECLDIELVVTCPENKFESDLFLEKLRNRFEAANDETIVVLSVFDGFWRDNTIHF